MFGLSKRKDLKEQKRIADTVEYLKVPVDAITEFDTKGWEDIFLAK